MSATDPNLLMSVNQPIIQIIHFSNDNEYNLFSVYSTFIFLNLLYQPIKNTKFIFEHVHFII